MEIEASYILLGHRLKMLCWINYVWNGITCNCKPLCLHICPINYLYIAEFYWKSKWLKLRYVLCHQDRFHAIMSKYFIYNESPNSQITLMIWKFSIFMDIFTWKWQNNMKNEFLVPILVEIEPSYTFLGQKLKKLCWPMAILAAILNSAIFSKCPRIRSRYPPCMLYGGP